MKIFLMFILLFLFASCTKPKVTVVSSTSLPVATTAGASAVPQSSSAESDAKMKSAIELWDKLRKLKPKTGEVPSEVKSLLGKPMDVGGFYIINEATVDGMSEFLLTPIAGGCIHVPPPPAQFIIHVQMQKGKKAPMAYGAVLVSGILTVTSNPKQRIQNGYEMTATKVVPFE